MELPIHSLNTLFKQLGLPSSDDEIEAFIKNNQLHHDCAMKDAPFWSPAQRQFLVEEYIEDADWVPWIDELDALLHRDAS